MMEAKKYPRGKNPNSLNNLRPQRSGEPSHNPKGRPPGSGLALLIPLIRVIDEQQSKIESQSCQIGDYVKTISQLNADLAEAWDIVEELNDVSNREALEASFYANCKENEELATKVEELRQQLKVKSERADKLLEELTPYRKAKMDEIRNRIDFENAGCSRR